MLKFIFFTLLLANGGLYAWNQGYLNDLLGSEHEPGRLKNQVLAEKVKPLSNASVQTALAAAARENGETPPAANPGPAAGSTGAGTATTAPAVEKKPEPIACTEIGNFLLGDAKRFETQLSILALGDRQARINIQEVASHMVFIPPQITKDKEGADKKAGELRQFGVTNFYVIQDQNSPMRWAISLGVFKTEEAAKNHLEALNKKGVHSARIAARSTNTNKVAFQLRNIDLDTRGKLDKIKAGFPNQEIRACSKRD